MIDEQIINIENAKTAKDTLYALNQGKEALNNLQKDVKIEELDKMKEDFEDLKEKDKEIGDYLKERGIEDEAEWEEELNELTKEIQKDNNINTNNENKNTNTNNNTNLQNIPNTNLNANNNIQMA